MTHRTVIGTENWRSQFNVSCECTIFLVPFSDGERNTEKKTAGVRSRRRSWFSVLCAFACDRALSLLAGIVHLEIVDSEILLSLSAALCRLTILFSSLFQSRISVPVFSRSWVAWQWRCYWYWHSTIQYTVQNSVSRRTTDVVDRNAYNCRWPFPDIRHRNAVKWNVQRYYCRKLLFWRNTVTHNTQTLQ